MRAGISLLVLLLVSCGGGGGPAMSGDLLPGEQTPDDGADPAPSPDDDGGLQNPRPAGSPDVLVVSVSGHSFTLSGLLCEDDDNRAYLADEGRAVEAVVEVFEALGLTVEAKNFSDRLRAPDDDGNGVPDAPDRLGFVEALAELDRAYEEWVLGFDNPTRLVLVAHSHGTNWSHVLAAVRPEIPVDIQVSLDGICFFFECEHESAIADFLAEDPDAFALDFSQPCDAVDVPGSDDPFNMKDVVYPNVVAHLEVQSSDLFVFDSTDNVRIDGTELGIARLLSTNNHSEVANAGDEAMNWVQDRILESLFPG